MDYRALLKKYINHIGECEGVYYLPEPPWWTEAEIEELERLVAEITEDYNQTRAYWKE